MEEIRCTQTRRRVKIALSKKAYTVVGMMTAFVDFGMCRLPLTSNEVVDPKKDNRP